MSRKRSDLAGSIRKWKKDNPELAVTFDHGYESFKIGVLLRQARKDSGLSQAQLAKIINTRRTAISQLENHPQDVKLSTIEKVARALGKRLHLRVA
jgi:DNA-binding XRE family transcriptional regulator